MDVYSVFALMGGLALFLYGMHMMSDNLEAAAGNKLKKWIERLTSNRFLGVLVGAGITAIIQSSSATTVMVVGFVNSKLMTLKQAVWVIMGANIGTTITGLLIAMDIGAIAPLFAFLGVIIFLFSKGGKLRNIGSIIAGLGMLFIGLDMMSAAMEPLRESEVFLNLMTEVSNPVLGILVGAMFTAIIQSSSASVGILQALAGAGLIDLGGAIYILFGQNIGTCITALFASIGADRNAKRATMIHFMFNIIGTCIFLIICLVSPYISWLESWTPNKVTQIANAHVIFNIVTTLLLLPFGGLLTKLACILLPDRKVKKTEADKWFEKLYSNNYSLGTSAIALENLKEELVSMYDLTIQNISQAFDAVTKKDLSLLENIRSREDKIDNYNYRLSTKISKVLSVEKSPTDIRTLSRLFSVVGNLERIGDHAINIAEYADLLTSKNLTFSEEVCTEIRSMSELCVQAISDLREAEQTDPNVLLQKIEAFENTTDDTTQEYRARQDERLALGTTDAGTAIIYSELLVDYERIGDHALNIAQSYDIHTENLHAESLDAAVTAE